MNLHHKFVKMICSTLLLVGILTCVLASANVVYAADESGSDENIGIKERTILNGRFVLPPPPHAYHPPGLKTDDFIRRPLIYWRAWINHRLPFRSILLFQFIVLTTLNLFFRPVLTKAENYYKDKWLRCLGIGTLLFIFGAIGAALMYNSGLLAPLATVWLGCVELVAVMGMCVVANNIGKALVQISGLNNLMKRPWQNYFIPLWLGSVVLSLLTFIPSIGPLTYLGNRLLLLITSTGAGAILMLIGKDKDQL